MGTDGAAGLEAAHAAGAYVLAQDEATSVVYGMAQEAVRRGAVDAVVPLEQIAARLVETVAPEAHVD
jgi:two-component system, chemotaxis family, protein-glutamate methylesterase/glutaminase